DDYVASPRMYVDLQRAARAHGKEEIDKLVAKAKKAGVRTSGLLLEGNPAQQIVRAAKSTRTDMIVMGTHGRTGLAKLFIGSVAQRVVSTAPCPVLTVRSRQAPGARCVGNPRDDLPVILAGGDGARLRSSMRLFPASSRTTSWPITSPPTPVGCSA